jgi:uncharacterized protein
MKKFALLLLLCFAIATPSVFGQQVVSTKAHKVVIQLTSNDTLVHKAVLKQINNLLTAAPNAKIEVVCHNNGIEFLTAAKTKQGAGITELKAKGVVFAACENTLRERKIEKTAIVPEAIFVPAGILEVVMKEEKGYSYLKAGF